MLENGNARYTQLIYGMKSSNQQYISENSEVEIWGFQRFRVFEVFRGFGKSRGHPTTR